MANETTNDPTTDPATELAALYPLMIKAGCWPIEIVLVTVDDGEVHLDIIMKGRSYYIPKNSPWWKHALSIARDAAEDWLIDERGWTMYRSEGKRKYCPPITGQHYSLTAAIEAELGRGEG